MVLHFALFFHLISRRTNWRNCIWFGRSNDGDNARVSGCRSTRFNRFYLVLLVRSTDTVSFDSFRNSSSGRFVIHFLIVVIDDVNRHRNLEKLHSHRKDNKLEPNYRHWLAVGVVDTNRTSQSENELHFVETKFAIAIAHTNVEHQKARRRNPVLEHNKVDLDFVVLIEVVWNFFYHFQIDWIHFVTFVVVRIRSNRHSNERSLSLTTLKQIVTREKGFTENEKEFLVRRLNFDISLDSFKVRDILYLRRENNCNNWFNWIQLHLDICRIVSSHFSAEINNLSFLNHPLDSQWLSLKMKRLDDGSVATCSQFIDEYFHIFFDQ